MKKIIITIASLGIFGASLTVPVIPQETEFYVRNKPSSESNFVVMKDVDVKGLKKAKEVGRACYSEFKKPNGKIVRERLSCDEYWKVAKVKNYPQPRKAGHEWAHSYETILFDTPSGDLEEGYYADGGTKEKKPLLGRLMNRANAAIAYDTTSNGGSVTVACSDSWSHTVTGSNAFLVLASHGEDSTDADEAIDSATYNGDALTMIESNIGSGMTVEIYYLIAPDTGSAYTVSVTWCSSGSMNNGGAGVMSYTGVDQVTGVDAHTNADFTNDSTPSITVTTVADNAWTVGVVGANITTGLADFASSQTGIFEIDTGLSSINAADSGAAQTPPGDVTLDWTCSGASCTSVDGAMAIMSFKPVAVAATYQSGLKVMIIN